MKLPPGWHLVNGHAIGNKSGDRVTRMLVGSKPGYLAWLEVGESRRRMLPGCHTSAQAAIDALEHARAEA